MTKFDFIRNIKRSIKITDTLFGNLKEGCEGYKFRVVTCLYKDGGESDIYFLPKEKKVHIHLKNLNEGYEFGVKGDNFLENATQGLADILYETKSTVKKYIWLGE